MSNYEEERRIRETKQVVINKAEVLKRFLFNNTELTTGVADFRYYFNNYTDCIVIKVFFNGDFIYRYEYVYRDFVDTAVCVLANRIVEALYEYRRNKYVFNTDAMTYCEHDTKVTRDLLYKSILNSTYGIPKNNPSIKKVIFNEPATIVFWDDGTKTVVKAEDETFDKEKGLAMAISKKFLGNKGNYYNEFKKWVD